MNEPVGVVTPWPERVLTFTTRLVLPPNSAGGPYGADGTLENSNSTYGPIVPLGSLGGRLDLPGAPTYRFVQSFGHA